MGLVFSIFLCLAVGETPEPWEDLLDHEHRSQWTGLENPVRKLDDGVMELAGRMSQIDVTLKRTLLQYELSYEFSVEEGAVHEMYIELVNGTIARVAEFVGAKAPKRPVDVGAGRWHSVQFIQREKSFVVLLDGKPFPDEKSSSHGWRSVWTLMPYAEKGIARIRNMRLLDLTKAFPHWPRAKDDQLILLKGLPHLQEIDLSGSEITDRGLAHLANFKTLRRVDVRDTKVTAHGIAELKEQLPECEIAR